MRTLIRFLQRYANFLLFLLLESLALILLARDPGYQRSQIVGVNRQIGAYLHDKTQGAREYLSLKENNLVLVEENARLRNKLDRLILASDSNVVRSTYVAPYHYQYIPARVVNNMVYRQLNYITLNKGRNQGVYRDMGVISEEGLVGIVLNSSANYSTVIPVINLDFRLSVKLASSQYSGILQWDGSSPRHAQLNEIPFHVDLLEHDTIVSSGFSSIFPEGIPVGRIESFSLEQGNFYEIRVELFTEFQRLYHVNVIRNHRQEEQIQLEESF